MRACVCVLVFVEQNYSKLIISKPNLYRAGMLDYMQTSNATNAHHTATTQCTKNFFDLYTYSFVRSLFYAIFNIFNKIFVVDII